MTGLPRAPRILDLGCGPGMQTLELLRLGAGEVVAVDLLPEMVARTAEAAAAAGTAARLTTRVADMNELDFPGASFDVVWSEGAIYIAGFEAGLKRLQPLLRPGAYVAVSDAVWLRPSPPREVLEFWEQYPEMDFVDARCRVIERLGYEIAGHFILPSEAWTEFYYDPMASAVSEMTHAWAGDEEGEAILAEARAEIALYSRYSEYYGYAFFVMRYRE